MSNEIAVRVDIPVTFPREIANQVIAEIQAMFGEEFSRKYPLNGREPQQYFEDMIQMARKVLSGLTPNDIRNGLIKLSRESYVPSLPKFRSLCEQGGSWLTQNEAWAQSLAYQANPKNLITAQAHQALDSVMQIINQEGQKAAFYAFRDIYQRIVDECKESRTPQTKYVPKLIDTPKVEPINAKPMPEHIREHIREQLQNAFRSV